MGQYEGDLIGLSEIYTAVYVAIHLMKWTGLGVCLQEACISAMLDSPASP